MLLVAVMGVIGGLTTQREVLAARSNHEAWHTRFLSQLTNDLIHSDRVMVAQEEVRLMGHAGRDPINGQMNHSPTIITYRTTGADESAWLLRIEEDLQSITNQNLTTEAVASRISRLALIDLTNESSQARSTTFSKPKKVRVLLYGSYGEMLIDKILMLR